VAWDTFGGLPDPYVCLTLNGVQTCSPYRDDTLRPTWNFVFPSVTAGMLHGGVLSVFGDDDYGTDDQLCATSTLAFTRAMFVAGAGSWECSSSWNYTLRAQ
jgi:hypothetical protein